MNLSAPKSVHVLRFTLKEYLEKRIYVIGLVAALINLGIVFVASSFTYGDPLKVALDYGLGMSAFFGLAFALCFGPIVLRKDIDNRTIYNIITKPVSRSQYMLGKILGLFTLTLMNYLIILVATLFFDSSMGGVLSGILLWAALFSLGQVLMLMLVTVLVSNFMNPYLGAFASLGVYIFGVTDMDFDRVAAFSESPWLRQALKGVKLVLPNFHRLNMKDYVVWEQPVAREILWFNLFYFLVYSLGLILVSIVLFNRQDLE